MFNHINGDLYAYAGNNPVRYIDPTGEFNWETNTVEPNDCLSKIAADCNAKYGTDYTADDLQSLNPHIENKDLIYVGDRLNLGKAEEVQNRAKDYIGRACTRFSNEQVVNIFTTNMLDTEYYSKRGNFLIGLGEVSAGVGIIIGGGFSAAALAPETMGGSAMIGYNALITGGATFAYGLSRMTGSNNKPLINDVRNILVPPMAVFAEINSKKVTK